jgi:hypothetical protein
MAAFVYFQVLLSHVEWILVYVPKISKNYYYIIPVCLTVCMKNSAATDRIFMKYYFGILLENMSIKSNFH